jgi:hypothetical protein
MELWWPVAVKTLVAIGLGVPLVLSFFGVAVLTRLRIIGAMATGAVLIGLLGWPLVKPADPFGAITIFSGNITVFEVLICGVLAFLSGVVAYFVCLPYGRHIGPLAGPTGLAVWGLRSGDMSSLLQMNHTLSQRQELYAGLRWEGFFWLAIVAASYLGVVAADKLAGSKAETQEGPDSGNFTATKVLSVATAVILTIVITQFLIGVLAQDVKHFDSQVGGFVVGQPDVGQIAFAVALSFGIAAFVAKRFLDASFVYPAIAAAGLVYFAITFFAAKQDILEHMVKTWPVTFFMRATCAILPLQMVAFAAFGSITGYWMAARYRHFRKQAA